MEPSTPMSAVLADLDDLIATFERELAPLDDAVLDRAPADGGWSPRQVIAHVALTARLYDERMRAKLAAVPGEGPPDARPSKSGWFARMLLKWLPDRSRRFKAPKAFDPRRVDETSDPAALLGVFRALRETAGEIADRHLAAARFGTPISRLLRMSLADGVRVQVAHGRRHLEQIRRLVDVAASEAS